MLVNCAVTIATGEKLVDMPVEAIQKEIGTNVLGNFYTIKEFLPDMLRLERGHIVTVSSALGFCGPARLSNSHHLKSFSGADWGGGYATSKAALLSLHESITAELGLSSPVKTTLVVAGQMYTPLFYGVHTPSTFLAPIVEPLDVARQIVSAVEERRAGEIYAPWYAGWMWGLRGIPVSLAWFVRWLGGVDGAMDRWGGPDRCAVDESTMMNGIH